MSATACCCPRARMKRTEHPDCADGQGQTPWRHIPVGWLSPKRTRLPDRAAFDQRGSLFVKAGTQLERWVRGTLRSMQSTTCPSGSERKLTPGHLVPPSFRTSRPLPCIQAATRHGSPKRELRRVRSVGHALTGRGQKSEDHPGLARTIGRDTHHSLS